MRRVIATLMLVMMCALQQVQAQTKVQYASIFGSSSTSWNIYHILIDHGRTDSVYVLKDTTIGGTAYRAISMMHWSTPTPYFLRESGDCSKAYLYAPTLSSAEYLVMDLNLQVSDTFLIGSNRDVVCVVDSVFTDAGGRKHIRFNYRFEELQYAKLEFIEGIGTNYGLFYQGISIAQIPTYHNLLCVHKNGALCYSNTAFNGRCSVTWMGIDANRLNGQVLRAFPNPTSGHITIDAEALSDSPVDVYIYSSSGQLVRTIMGACLPVSLDVPMPEGIYIIRLYARNEVFSTKFVVAK